MGFNNSLLLLEGSARFTALSTLHQVKASLGKERDCAICAASPIGVSISSQRHAWRSFWQAIFQLGESLWLACRQSYL